MLALCIPSKTTGDTSGPGLAYPYSGASELTLGLGVRGPSLDLTISDYIPIWYHRILLAISLQYKYKEWSDHSLSLYVVFSTRIRV